MNGVVARMVLRKKTTMIGGGRAETVSERPGRLSGEELAVLTHLAKVP